MPCYFHQSAASHGFPKQTLLWIERSARNQTCITFLEGGTEEVEQEGDAQPYCDMGAEMRKQLQSGARDKESVVVCLVWWTSGSGGTFIRR